ncbi:MAG: hypothetical protein ACFBSF_13900 [Leptolyngbyaceae cyanobacterium]
MVNITQHLQLLEGDKPMAVMGNYCKAYSLKQLRQFHQWSEKVENASQEQQVIDGKTVETTRSLTDDDFVYLHANYVVTDGIFMDENILFENISPEWKDFCNYTLKFEIPTYESINTNQLSKATPQ